MPSIPLNPNRITSKAATEYVKAPLNMILLLAFTRDEFHTAQSVGSR